MTPTPLNVVRIRPERQETLVCAALAAEQNGTDHVAAVLVGDYANGSVIRTLLNGKGIDLYVVSLRKPLEAVRSSLDAAGYGPSLIGRSWLRGSHETLVESLSEVLARQVADALSSSSSRGYRFLTPEEVLPSLQEETVTALSLSLGVALPPVHPKGSGG